MDDRDRIIERLTKERDALALAFSFVRAWLSFHQEMDAAFSTGDMQQYVRLQGEKPTADENLKGLLLRVDYASQLDAHDAEVRKPLVEALKPFAEVGARLETPDDWILEIHVTVGTIRRAHQALAAIPKEPKP